MDLKVCMDDGLTSPAFASPPHQTGSVQLLTRKTKFLEWARTVPWIEGHEVDREFTLQNMKEIVKSIMLEPDTELQKFLWEEVQLMIADEARAFEKWAEREAWMKKDLPITRDFLIERKGAILDAIEHLKSAELQLTLLAQFELLRNSTTNIKLNVDGIFDRIMLELVDDPILGTSEICLHFAILAASFVYAARMNDDTSLFLKPFVTDPGLKRVCGRAFLAWLASLSSDADLTLASLSEHKNRIALQVRSHADKPLQLLLLGLLDSQGFNGEVNASETSTTLKPYAKEFLSSFEILSSAAYPLVQNDIVKAIAMVTGPKTSYIRHLLEVKQIFELYKDDRSSAKYKAILFDILTKYHEGYADTVIILPLLAKGLDAFTTTTVFPLPAEPPQVSRFTGMLADAVSAPVRALNVLWESIWSIIPDDLATPTVDHTEPAELEDDSKQLKLGEDASPRRGLSEEPFEGPGLANPLAQTPLQPCNNEEVYVV